MYNYNVINFISILNLKIRSLNKYKDIEDNDKNELFEIVESILFYKSLFTYDSIDGHNYELEISKSDLDENEINLFLTDELVFIICNELEEKNILIKKGELI